MRAVPTLFVPVVLLSLLAGCAAPGGPAERVAASTSPLESAACGFALVHPDGWAVTGGDEMGVFMLDPPGDTAEAIAVSRHVGVTLDDVRTLLEAENVTLFSSLWTDPVLATWSNATLDGRPAIVMNGEAQKGSAVLAWNVTVADTGAQLIALAWTTSVGEEPSSELQAASTSLRILSDATPACGAGREAAPISGERFRNDAYGWSWQPQPTWSHTDLSGSGAAILFHEAAEDGYGENVMVAIRIGLPEDVTLDDVKEEVERQLESRVTDFQLTAAERTTLAGQAAWRLESTETHGDDQLVGLRHLSIHEDRFVLVEALAALDDEARFWADVEAALATFAFDP